MERGGVCVNGINQSTGYHEVTTGDYRLGTRGNGEHCMATQYDETGDQSRMKRRASIQVPFPFFVVHDLFGAWSQGCLSIGRDDVQCQHPDARGRRFTVSIGIMFSRLTSNQINSEGIGARMQKWVGSCRSARRRNYMIGQEKGMLEAVFKATQSVGFDSRSGGAIMT